MRGQKPDARRRLSAGVRFLLANLEHQRLIPVKAGVRLAPGALGQIGLLTEMLEILFSVPALLNGNLGQKTPLCPLYCRIRPSRPISICAGSGQRVGSSSTEISRLHSGHSDFSRGGKRGSLKAAALAMFQTLIQSGSWPTIVPMQPRSWPFSAIVTNEPRLRFTASGFAAHSLIVTGVGLRGAASLSPSSTL